MNIYVDGYEGTREFRYSEPVASFEECERRKDEIFGSLEVGECNVFFVDDEHYVLRGWHQYK